MAWLGGQRWTWEEMDEFIINLGNKIDRVGSKLD